MNFLIEITNIILIKINSLIKNILSGINSLFFYIYCKFIGVELYNNVKCWGLPSIFRYPKSKIRIGKNCRFRSKVTSNLIGINHKCIISTMNENAKIIIGDNCGFSGVVIGAFIEISIDDNVLVGANCLITDSNWHLQDHRSGQPKKIKICKNVWIGYGSIILKGVTIGENSIIGAGSVVVNDIPPNVIAAGNPCKIIRDIKY